MAFVVGQKVKIKEFDEAGLKAREDHPIGWGPEMTTLMEQGNIFTVNHVGKARFTTYLISDKDGNDTSFTWLEEWLEAFVPETPTVGEFSKLLAKR